MSEWTDNLVSAALENIREDEWPSLPLREGDSVGYKSRLMGLGVFISTLVLTGVIFQIYGPQSHGVLDHESDSTNEFPPTVRLPFLQKP